MNSKLIWPGAILLGIIILAATLTGIQNNKQKSIEKIANDKIVAEQQAENARQFKLDVCLERAFSDYNLNWNTACESLNKEDNCLLPSARAKNINDYKDKDEANCFKRYK